jgi:iron complex outermembrane receptor protein
VNIRFRLPFPFWVTLVGWGSCGVAFAADEDIYFSELPVVASVSRLPQRLADAPTAVTVVDRDMIKASGARDLNDIFRLVPGFQTYPNNTEPAKVTYHGMGDGD